MKFFTLLSALAISTALASTQQMSAEQTLEYCQKADVCGQLTPQEITHCPDNDTNCMCKGILQAIGRCYPADGFNPQKCTKQQYMHARKQYAVTAVQMCKKQGMEVSFRSTQKSAATSEHSSVVSLVLIAALGVIISI